MKSQLRSFETEDIEHFEQLQSHYQSASIEIPNEAIDRQIIAAAQRELAHPNAKKAYRVPWWRRLSLPLYVAASFTFAALATHWFWQGEPVKTLPGTAASSVTFEVMPSTSEETAEQKRTKKSLPKLTEMLAPPNVAFPIASSKSVSQPPFLKLPSFQKDNIGDLLQLETDSLAVDNNSTSNADSFLAKWGYPDKESWAREIIEMMKKGEYIRAKKELIKFKQNFPDYPIDEQLEVFRQ